MADGSITEGVGRIEEWVNIHIRGMERGE